ncbi:trehalose-6-phosphate synthase [Nitrospirillum sp. BR 11164]|uniref:alpha,alpha-trehalose-phosphate synthase (UDP-forming) n=1 Tax=Nitrospirillum sp. BR 11164 TaxID=3104324 RepID=UPI002AFFBF9E|nr:trehalose-6-phosphate synthase [Nitrospirillum sp. BR 11164]MEA1647405.1 trehalose-6-phosphate synthase [Nitrospirillum sp. BR 11164]
MMDIDLGALLSQDSAAVYLVGASLLLSVAALVLSTALLLRWGRNRHAPMAEVAIPSYDETRRQILAEGSRAPSPVVGARDAHAAAQRALRSTKGEGVATDRLGTWTPDTLRHLLKTELTGAQVIVVSNREPFIHDLEEGGAVKLRAPAGGLVAALDPVMRTCAGTWIAHGSGSADHLTVDADDRIAVPPDNPSYTLRRVWLSEREEKHYYYGFSNDGLWPLCHVAFTRPSFNAEDWEVYEAVNQRFADVVVEEARDERPVVLIQDYHFALLPRMIRERLPDAVIITFWHIPWPNAEIFGICPWRERILDGMLGSSVMGFHTQYYCNNFIETVDRFLESRIERDSSAVTFGGHTTHVHAHPISIEWPPASLSRQPPVPACRRALFDRFNLAPDMKLCVGVERFDYTKGIIDRFRAVEELFKRHPEWIGRMVVLQVAAPSRTALPAYQQCQRECLDYVDELNARYGHEGYQPIHLLNESYGKDEVYGLLRAADLCMVTSLHDGMNLVAKEFVAAREDEQGVLLLSSFAGAAKELPESIIINPYDTCGTADALLRGLTMSPEEQRERMRRMRETVRENNIYRWAGNMLLDGARLRKRHHTANVTARLARQQSARGALGRTALGRTPLGRNVVRLVSMGKGKSVEPSHF